MLAQEQAAALLTMQAQVMGGKVQTQTQTQQQPPAPKRKQPIMGMDDFIKSQGLM